MAMTRGTQSLNLILAAATGNARSAASAVILDKSASATMRLARVEEIGDGTVNAAIREVLTTGLYRRSSSMAVGGEGTARHVGVGEHRYRSRKRTRDDAA